MKPSGRSGFSARGAEVSVRGVVQRAEGRRVLTTPADERFVLVAAADGDALLLEPRDGTPLEVEGSVEREGDERGRWLLRVERMGDARTTAPSATTCREPERVEKTFERISQPAEPRR